MIFKQGAPIQSTHNGKWRTVIQGWRSHNGKWYMNYQVESSPIWSDAKAAQVAGCRAINLLRATDKLPNMCEIW